MTMQMEISLTYFICKITHFSPNIGRNEGIISVFNKFLYSTAIFWRCKPLILCNDREEWKKP